MLGDVGKLRQDVEGKETRKAGKWRTREGEGENRIREGREMTRLPPSSGFSALPLMLGWQTLEDSN